MRPSWRDTGQGEAARRRDSVLATPCDPGQIPTRGPLLVTLTLALLAALALAVLAAGCGSGDVRDLPPAAEPARSPPATVPAAGRLLRLGSMPEGIVADSVTGTVATSLRNPDVLALIDGRRGRVLGRVAIPESARHLALGGPGGPVLVPAERADELARVSLPGGEVSRVGVGAHPHDAATAGGRVFVGDERAGTLSVVEPDARVRRIRVARQPGGLAALDRGRRVAVVSVRERVLEVYDSDTLRRVGRADAGVGPTHVVSNGRETLYVTDTAGDALLVFRLRPRVELIRRYALPGVPYGIAVDRVRARLWVTLTATNELLELSAGTRPRVLRRFATPRQPDSVAVDERAGRVYVTGTAEGVLQLLDPDEPVSRR